MDFKKMLKKILPRIGDDNESERVEWLAKTLKNIPSGKILDAGAGECQFEKFCNHLEYVSQDFAQYDGFGDKGGLQTKNWDNTKLDIVSDITNIPVEDASFDVVMCTEVFEHIPNPLLAIKEFSRILKPGGTLIITAPFNSLTHFSPYHFCSGFNRYFYKINLTNNNFAIKEISPNGNYFKFIAQEIRRIPYVAENYSKSKIGLFSKIILFFALIILKRINKKDINSNTLACFGYHVVANKK